MSHLRAILTAGACSLALSGCLPAAAGLALSAANLVAGGGSGQGGNNFHNPIDRQSTGRQVRQALSRLDDRVDPACQAMLDEHQKTHGTLTAGAVKTTPAETAAAAREKAAADEKEPAETKPKEARPPKNLLAKLAPDLEAPAGASDVAVSADEPLPAGADAKADADKTTADTAKAEGGAAEIAAVPDQPAEAGLQPVKASLGPDTAPAPGSCEHRWVCLPGTPKPTIMLMCPGKGSGKPDTGVTAAADAPASGGESAAGQPDRDTAVATSAPEQEPEQKTAALGRDESAADSTPAAADSTPAGAASGKAEFSESAAEKAETSETAAVADRPEPEPESERRTIESGGVADWNWSFDPSKQL